MFDGIMNHRVYLDNTGMEIISWLVLLVQDTSECEDGGQMFPLVSNHETVSEVVFEKFFEGILDGDGSNVLSASSDDDLLLSAGHEEEAVLVVPPQVAAHDVTLSIEKLAGLLLLPDVAHASVPSPGSNLSEASLVRVENIHLPAVVRSAHAAQPDAPT